MQLTVGGFPEQLASHSAAKFAWHEAVQWVLSALELHRASHWPVALALQLALQSNCGPCALQLVSQSASQLPSQLTDGTWGHMAWQVVSRSAAHATSKFTGVHCAVQLACTSAVQVPCASMSMLPHWEMPAWAVAVDSSGKANNAAAKAPRAKEFFI
ncbi:MAG TPA: hypothetical protein VII41_17940 [Steroidobacteraceae bacterium]